MGIIHFDHFKRMPSWILHILLPKRAKLDALRPIIFKIFFLAGIQKHLLVKLSHSLGPNINSVEQQNIRILYSYRKVKSIFMQNRVKKNEQNQLERLIPQIFLERQIINSRP
ncbi:unnamed protein product [Trifolium pratense]|uniref:Uncharacterized protein n=1 Tax=Trifolium pratense TaxID=57577 RepID=A0ACB0KIJ7_TRIPR|nr:unnamed protein product [Trifolium pratense]